MSISVCMTTYNGEKYIYKQLKSILDQIAEHDEVIICDDQSKDSTLDIVKSIQDPRIKVYVNERNLGFNRNFSRSISLATGEIIFMADQDDIWLPHKLNSYLKIFEENDEVLAIMSNMELIDEYDQVTCKRFLNLHSGYGNRFLRLTKNFVKSTYYGCSMAFRKEIKEKVLPLPFHFDTWIGLVSNLYGKCYHLDKVTMQYRRHSNNFSSLKRSSFITILRWRSKLLLNIITLILGLRKLATKYNFCQLLDG